MESGPDLSIVAALMGDPARAAILSALLGGQALPAGELADRAHVTPQTASAHLSKLVAGGLLGVKRMGRHRYYHLKNAEVARALEALLSISPPVRQKPGRSSSQHQALCYARTCYDHLAGELGVAVTQAVLKRGWLVADGPSFALTPAGSEWLAAWNIDEAGLRRNRRLFAPACLDWSERQDHLAGALGAALAGYCLEKAWLKRMLGTRAIQITETGRHAFARELGVDLPLQPHAGLG